MKRVGLVVAVVVSTMAVACGGGNGGEADSEPTPSGFTRKTAILEGDGEPMLLEVEVAETSEEHAQGLMGRESLPEDEGMIFIFFEEHSGGFWMKNTLIPLSVAFFDARGKILEILHMEPCKADPCPVYDPGVSYNGALEVNQGMFEEWDIGAGDYVRMNQ